MSVNEPDRSKEALAKIRLGEELPVFCEKCGYSLHGLEQSRCDCCNILQFMCPECGHHQPINTLRPAFAKTLGRYRGTLTVSAIFFKLNFFGWLLVAWSAIGYDTVRRNYDYVRVANSRGSYTYQTQINATPRPYKPEMMFLVATFAFFFALVGRWLLLRWRRGWWIGLTIGILVVFAMLTGVGLRALERMDDSGFKVSISPAFWSYSFGALIACIAGATVAWGVWVALVTLFVPKKTAKSLLDWQRSLSRGEEMPPPDVIRRHPPKSSRLIDFGSSVCFCQIGG